MTKEIDQRAQRHDPASKHTHDSNDRPDDQTKQPGKIDSTIGGPDQIAAADGSRTSHNARDDGRGEITTDDPVPHIKRTAENDGDSGADHKEVRPAGTDDMKNPPKSWTKEDEESDESFPASDPPGNY